MTGFVHHFFDGANPVVLKPDGTELQNLDVATQGLRTAIEFAEGYELPFRSDGPPGFVEVTDTIRFGATTGLHYELNGLRMRSTAPGPVTQFDASMFAHIRWTGFIEALNGGVACHLIKPENRAPGDYASYSVNPIMKHGEISMPFTWRKGGNATKIVRFDTSAPTALGQSICDMTFRFGGVNGNNAAGVTGFHIDNPSTTNPKQSCFAENKIDVGFVGACTLGIVEGSGPINHQVQPVNTNIFDGNINADSDMIAYLCTFAEHGTYNLRSMSVNAGTVQFGAIFNTTAKGAVANLPQMQAQTSVYFGGSKCKVYAPDTGTSGPPIGNGANGNQLIQ